jgi:hypothetical protein
MATKKKKAEVEKLPQIVSKEQFNQAELNVKSVVSDFDNMWSKFEAKQKSITFKDFFKRTDIIEFLNRCKRNDLTANQARLFLCEAMGFSISKQTFNESVKDLNIFEFPKKGSKMVKSKISPEPKGEKEQMKDAVKEHKDVADAPKQNNTITPSMKRGAQ